MVETLTIVYLSYMFISLYFLLLFTLTFIQNRKQMFDVPESKNKPSLSILIPAFNEESSIEGTVEAILNSDYENLKEVIIINDGSSDNTKKIALDLEKKYSKVHILDKENSGKADSLNQAIKIAKSDLVAVVDADSYPSEKAFSEMIGFFNEDKVGAVTTRIIVRNPTNFIQTLQSVEYKVIAFTRKLLGFLDAIYVTPGPLAIYRKSILKEVKGFDVKNMTEDIEITWRLAFHDYKVKMSFLSQVSTVSPDTFKKWFKQRIRWNIGGFQTILKYKKYFFRKGMLGFFILPFFTISLVLGAIGLGIFVYRITIRFITSYLSTKQSIASEVAIIALQDINLHPSILHFFGVTLFLLGLIFVFFALSVINREIGKKENFFSVVFYLIIYATLYPLVLISSLYKFLRGNYTWR